MKAKIHVTLRKSILDPQGNAIEGALAGLGFEGVSGVRQGKVIELDIAESDPTKAKAQVEDMCKKLLANPVMENYEIELVG